MTGADAHWTRVRTAAAAAGVPLVGAAALDALHEPHRRWREWVAAGRHAGMDWLAADGDIRREPARWFDGCRSIVVGGFPYAGEPPPGPLRIARFARGEDYHRVVRRRLQTLLRELQREDPAVRGRVAVDTAPLMEKPLAVRAGLGFIGRNTCLIHPGHGSYLCLGVLLLNIPLPPSPPANAGCGDCRRCLEACPTGALSEPGVLDARRCLSYLTIEHRETIPADFRGRLTGNLFGCDRCQEACPFNRGPGLPPVPEPADPGTAAVPVPAELARMSGREFQRRFGRTALARAGRRGLLRNWAALVPELPAPPDPETLTIARQRHPLVDRQFTVFDMTR
ncbi:MAG TPA: tRNA epoxyqueuosine(34) reductase QueG [Acidobacteriota bacterium]|nr:tRNA epoxyqueuosine(34) reductase QueG [Acidobacteriota bacterium]HNU02043.1 tRNA epoxyqueuosine(34) reductase QueG [Acidobacteriota bacterium]HPB28274.1 tRNA epoxyqueuosine(34) reductase QueG [Acidobacteriota bacterium]HQO26125.1 tRNA epoxyqueuosine(34) reductase QueG [Acidobacteriota bacterium]HQP74407.1 tRNA epoxyqueuosine(34) reductase QueG [Acidobacteriota bacterium]